MLELITLADIRVCVVQIFYGLLYPADAYVFLSSTPDVPIVIPLRFIPRADAMSFAMSFELEGVEQVVLRCLKAVDQQRAQSLILRTVVFSVAYPTDASMMERFAVQALAAVRDFGKGYPPTPKVEQVIFVVPNQKTQDAFVSATKMSPD